MHKNSFLIFHIILTTVRCPAYEATPQGRFNCVFTPCKVRHLFPMVVVSILPLTEFRPNDHLEEASHFTRRKDAVESALRGSLLGRISHCG